MILTPSVGLSRYFATAITSFSVNECAECERRNLFISVSATDCNITLTNEIHA